MKEEKLLLIVTGRVQGVGFRWHVAAAARRLGLAGWVRNRSDGSVEVCASGPSDTLCELEKIVREGPAGAVVSDVARANSVMREELTRPFSIARD